MKFTGNEIENWAIKLEHESQVGQMTENESKLFIRCCFNEKQIENDPSLNKVLNEFVFQLIIKRLNYIHSYKLTKAVILFLGYIVKSPGEAVMYLNYLQYQSHKRELGIINMHNLAIIFPMGFFTPETLTKAWNDQKVEGLRGTDNLLDVPEAMRSIYCEFE